jgi:hypothetical protein
MDDYEASTATVEENEESFGEGAAKVAAEPATAS